MDTVPHHAQIGNPLLALRKQKGYTQVEIANILGVSPSFLSNAEHGKRCLSSAQMKIIEELPLKDVRPVEKPCIECGKNFPLPKTRPDKRFCSKACWEIHNPTRFEYICPQCHTAITYKLRSTWNCAKRRGVVCKKCRYINQSGDKNPFYGRQHSQESKNIISQKTGGQRRSPKTEFKKGLVTLNSMPLYEGWVQKYGQDEADRRLTQFKQKQSAAHSGDKNNMFGRPPTQGSGNGWSGWYKGYYFRSLHELSYIVNVLEKQGLSFESAEQRKYQMVYVDRAGTTKHYYADFIVENRVMVECKPQKLHASETVVLKENAARSFCSENGLEYVIIDPPGLSNQEIRKLYESGFLRWLPRYQQKYEERYGT